MKQILRRIVTFILIKEASILLHRHKPVIIAVTGSVGKTTTKDAIYAAIKDSVSARKSEKSFNSEIGVPLTILGLPNAWSNPFMWVKNLADGLMTCLFIKDYPQVLVLEAGIDRPRDMEKLVSWLPPDIVVLTRLPSVPVHVEFFPTPEAVAEEKMKLVYALPSDGVFIYNNDDPIIQAQLENVLQKSIGYSRYLKSDFTASDDKIIYRDDIPVGTEFTANYKDKSVDVRISDTIGTQQVYSGMAALAVANALQITLEKAAKSLATLETPNGRLKVIRGLKASTIIDDTYNSSPTACEQALQTLNEVKYAKRKILVLGDMLELGRYSSEQHEKIGTKVPPVAKILITVGVRARKFAEGALMAGMPEQNIFQYDDALTAGKELQNMLQPGDVVLVKASQGIRAERIVEEIMGEPDGASELLVRQDKSWISKK